MIKHINHQNFLTTPFVAAKSWKVSSRDIDDLLLLETTGSEDTVALEFVDYSTDNPFVNSECSIALDHQPSDVLNFQAGATGSGKFYPTREEINSDGTYKRLVHAQIKSTFYNKYNDPTKIFGIDYIDFPLGRTFRDLSNVVRVFNIPQHVFGERVVENTVRLNDTALDDNVEITDDGYQNLIARHNLFSKVQEVRSFGNIIISGTSSYVCYDTNIQTNAIDSGSTLSVGFVSGELENVPTVENDSLSVAFYTGSLAIGVITSSVADSGSLDIGFYTGSLADNVITTSGSAVSGSMEIGFYTGSLFDQMVTGSATTDENALSVTFASGLLFNEVVTSSVIGVYDSSSMAVGFVSGILS